MDSTATLLQRIAHHVKKRRQDKNWTQQELASQSGVSRRMIALLEQAESNVSLATLDKIALALGTSLSQLISDEAPAPVQMIPAESMPVVWHNAQNEARFVVDGLTRERTEVWHWVMAPQGSYDAEADPAGTQELVYVLEGTLLLKLESGDYRLSSGDALRFPSDAPFRYQNLSDAPTRFLKVFLT
ncbi:MAG: helix-turn-helix domain-containing protein [Candidatus Sericytochromatia bacterium]